MGWIRRVLVLVVVLVAGVVLMRNALAKSVLSMGINKITGLPADVKSVDVDLGKQAVGVRNLQVFQPEGFPDGVMVSVPEIFIDYRLAEFFKGKAHIEEMRLHLDELHVMKAEDGRLNLRSIKAIEAGKAQRAQSTAEQQAPSFQIDSLQLQVGKVVYTDHTVSPPAVREYPVNINEQYQGITNPYTFAGLVISRALMKTTVASLTNFDAAGLQRDVTTALRASAGALSGRLTEGLTAAQKAGHALEGDALGAAERVGQGTAGAAKDAVDEAAGRLKKVFGN